MRIAYVLLWNVQSGGGIAQKVCEQKSGWENCGHVSRIFCNVLGGVDSPKTEWLKSNTAYYFRNWTDYLLSGNVDLLKELKKFAPDIIYLRFEMYQPYHSKLRAIAPVVMELNADDIAEYKMYAGRKLSSRLIYIYHRLTRRKLFNSVDGLVAVTYELANLHSNRQFKKPIVVIPNAVDLDNSDYTPRISVSDKPQLLFIGSNNVTWHGVDKIVSLASKTEKLLEFHIVGNIQPSLDSGPTNITYHGYLSQPEIQKLLVSMDVGIGSMSYYLKDMHELCSLKTRNYLSAGTPVILGCEDTAFINSEKPDWVLQLPNQPNNVSDNVELIVNFANSMKGYQIPKELVRPYVDSKVFELQRLEFFEKMVNRK